MGEIGVKVPSLSSRGLRSESSNSASRDSQTDWTSLCCGYCDWNRAIEESIHGGDVSVVWLYVGLGMDEREAEEETRRSTCRSRMRRCADSQ